MNKLVVLLMFLVAAAGIACGEEVSSGAYGLSAPTGVPTGAVVNAVIVDFDHQDVSAKVGTTVVWTNTGDKSHSTSERAGLWDSRSFGPGETYSYTFALPGTYNYRCSIHPAMTAVVTVTE